ncbi:hypothetical protein [Phytoactinopolyspora limicola]|uniref:hypothetical protein n=1 Tax=Phytoactinopolyspora limicola TaxID=2715536 RepID=UPI0014090E24|nr:hypothetical protein [Phytoactinopolyspora limicola]
MKRSTFDGQVVVYQYRVRSVGVGVDGARDNGYLPAEAMGQLRLAHELRNDLVRIERDHADAKARVWMEHPQIAAAQAAVDTAKTAVDEAEERARGERQRLRSTKISGALRDELRDLRARRKAAREDLAAARQEHWPAMQARFAALQTERRAAIKDLYRVYCATSNPEARGLYWATHNHVVARHDTAVQQVEAKRKRGEAAELRFHRWDGTGTLAVQLQRQAGDPARSPELIASGEGQWRGVFQLRPWADPAIAPRPRGKDRDGDITMALGGGRTLTLPVRVHRFIPADADITDVQLTRERVGPHYRLHVSVSVRLPHPDVPQTRRATAAVRLANQSSAAGILVARIAASVALPPAPRDLADVVRVSGRSADVHVPDTWRALWRRDDDIRSIRDDRMEALREAVIAALTEDPTLGQQVGVPPWARGDEDGPLRASVVAQWRAPRKFVWLARQWPAGHELAGQLEQWRHRDRHLWTFEAHERDALVAKRRDAYRKVAAWLCDVASEIALDGTDLAAARRVPDVSSEDKHGARGARRLAAFAAPGELRQAIENAARRRGISVLYAEEGPA